MQVRKFEARTMKEALEMVKMQLGPDAIILGVKDNKKSFGLVGETSIEITAAVSEETLHKKKFAESRMRESEKQKLHLSSARSQKEFINRMVTSYKSQSFPPTMENTTETKASRPRYIDIRDEVPRDFAVDHEPGVAKPIPVQPKPTPARAPVATSPAPSNDSAQVNILRAEIAQLRQVIKGFQSVPQGINEARRTNYPGSDYGLTFETSSTFEKLTEAGVHPEYTAEILLEAQKKLPAHRLKNKALIEAWVAKRILDTTLIAEPKPNHKIHVFIGPSGAGKTSALVKLASHSVVNDRKRVGLLTADTQKLGATEQMKTYAQILNVPFGIIREQKDWDNLRPQLSNFDLVLVDMPGLSLKSLEENSLLRSLLPSQQDLARVHLVLEATAKDSDVSEVGKRYKGHSVSDVIFTNLDLSVQHGTIYNLMKRFQLPLHSFSIGPRVPEDFEMATRERVLDLIFKLTQIQTHQNGDT